MPAGRPKGPQEVEGIPISELKDWPNKAKAARLMGVSTSSLNRMRERGDIQAVKWKDVWRFNPEEVADFEEANAKDPNGQLFTEAVSLADRAQQHAQEFGQLVLQPAQQYYAALKEENTDLRKRVHELEEKLNQSFKDREEAQSKAHERMMAERELDAKLRMRERAFSTLKDYAPLVLSQLQRTSGGKGVEVLLDQLLGSLEDEQWMKLAQSGILNEAQMMLIAEMKKAVDSQRMKKGKDDDDSEHPANG